jgi:hypothetical protein
MHIFLFGPQMLSLYTYFNRVWSPITPNFKKCSNKYQLKEVNIMFHIVKFKIERTYIVCL